MKFGTKTASAFVTALTCVGLAGCGNSTTEETAGSRLKVVAAFGPIAEAAATIGGVDADVVNLTGVGVEPHDLELSSDQIDLVLDADLVVYVGEGFQPSLEEALRNRKGPSIDALKSVAVLDADHAEEGDAKVEEHSEHGEHDPHFWLDPVRLSTFGDTLAQEFVRLRPKSASSFTSNKSQWSKELGMLDAEFAATASSCARREFVTAHSAFAYLADRYSLTQIAVTGVSPEAEPDPRRMAEIADLVKAKGVTTIFTEELVSPKVAEALARESNVTTAVLSPIEGFTPEEIARGVTYIDKMRANLAALKKALDCSA